MSSFVVFFVPFCVIFLWPCCLLLYRLRITFCRPFVSTFVSPFCLRVAFFSSLCVDLAVAVLCVVFNCRLCCVVFLSSFYLLCVVFLWPCCSLLCRLRVVFCRPLASTFVSLLRVAFVSTLLSPFCVSPIAFLCRFFVIVCLFVVSASPFVAPSYLHLCRLFLVAFVAFLLSSFSHLFPDVTRGRRRLRRICPAPLVASAVYSSLLSPVEGVTSLATVCDIFVAREQRCRPRCLCTFACGIVHAHCC